MSATSALVKRGDQRRRRRMLAQAYSASMVRRLSPPGMARQSCSMTVQAVLVATAWRRDLECERGTLQTVSRFVVDTACFNKSALNGQSSEEARLFLSFVLFEEYCERLHVGLRLDKVRAQLLSAAICRSLRSADLSIWKHAADGYWSNAARLAQHSALATRAKEIVGFLRSKLSGETVVVPATAVDDELAELSALAPIDEAIDIDGTVMRPIVEDFHAWWRQLGDDVSR